MKIKSILSPELVWYKGFVVFFFIVYAILGVAIYKDYGIHWDHDNNKHYGQVTFQIYYDTLVGEPNLDAIQGQFAKIHGPAFEVFLNALERILAPEDARDKAFLRHLATFILFYLSTIFFYLLCKRHFNSWRMGLLGSVLFVLSPRIFAHSFYNTVDIACLSFFIISIYTLINFLEKKTLSRAVIHAFTCAILIDIRNFGVFVPLLTFFLVTLDGLQSNYLKVYLKQLFPPLALYIFLLVIFTVSFWPYLWESPLTRFIDSFTAMADTRWGGSNLYFGQYIPADELPWHYNFVWMSITIPLFYSITFVLGLFVSVRSLFSSKDAHSIRRNNVIFVLWLSLPLTAPVILQSTLFDGWRHHYFVYPAFLIIALSGIRCLVKFHRRNREGRVNLALTITVIAMFTANISYVVDFMVRYHPYQNVYFNALAGKDLRKRFELDYWGLSYREALKHILENDPAPTIEVAVGHTPGVANIQILVPEDRKRLRYAGVDEAKYFLSTFRWHKEDYPYKDEFYSIKVSDEKIMVVYRLR